MIRTARVSSSTSVATEISYIELLHESPYRSSSAEGTAAPVHATIEDLAQRCANDIERLDVGVRRLVNPHRYPDVSVTDRLHELRLDLIANAQN